MTETHSELDNLSADELRQRLLALQEENKALTTLVSTIAFEFRTPLTAIEAYANLLLAEDHDLYSPLDEEQTKAVEAMKNSVRRSNEVVDDVIKIVAQARTPFEKLGAGLIKDYRHQLREANQQLEKMKLKHEAVNHIIANVANEFMSSSGNIIGFSRLYLEQPELMGGSLNEEQLEGIEIIHRYAEKILEAIQYYFFHNLRALEAIDQKTTSEKLTIAEIGEMSGILAESDLNRSFSILTNKRDFEAIIRLLNSHGVGNHEVVRVIIVEATNDLFRFILPSALPYSSYYVERVLDKETGRLGFPETERYSDPFGLATALVEKYGGAVYAELGSDSEYTLSFTLPVYREDA